MRNYDGVHACQTTRREIERAGYVCAFTTLFSDSSCPTEVLKCKHDGWAIRRAMKAWAKSQGVEDYRIFRATDYLRDLHGSATYEMFVKRATPPTNQEGSAP